MYFFVLGIIVGLCGSFYLLMQQQNKSERNEAAWEDESVFINLLVLDKSEGVEMEVVSSIGKKFGVGKKRQALSRVLGKMASKIVSDEKVGEVICAKIIKGLLPKLTGMGVEVTAKTVFHRKAFFVIQVSLTSVDLKRLYASALKTDHEQADKFDAAISAFGGEWMKHSLESRVIPMVCSKLEEDLPRRIGEELVSKGMKCELIVKSTDDQAKFFFEMLEQLNNNVTTSSSLGSSHL
jgi:hypothetical protein